MVKKGVIGILCVLVFFSIGHISVSAASSEEEREEYARIADAFGCYYTKGDKTDFPDYFAGMYFLNDGKLIFYLTNTEPETIDLICSICECDTIEYKKVTYSFNQLYGQMMKNKEYWDELGIVSQALDIPENRINVYFDSESEKANSKDGLELFSMNDFNAMCNLIPYVSDDQVIADLKMKEDLSERSERILEEEVETEEASIEGAKASRILIGAPGEAIRTYDDNAGGTIGFYVTYGSGKRGLITHGHSLGVGNKYAYLWETNDIIGEVKYIYGIGGSKADASLIDIADSSIKLSNQIYGTTCVVSNYITIERAVALGNKEGYFKGAVSRVKPITINVIMEKDNFRIAWSNNLSQKGDSGEPIYTRVGTNATLYGLVSQQPETEKSTGNSYGIYVQSILDVSRDIFGVPLTFYKE